MKFGRVRFRIRKVCVTIGAKQNSLNRANNDNEENQNGMGVD